MMSIKSTGNPKLAQEKCRTSWNGITRQRAGCVWEVPSPLGEEKLRSGLWVGRLRPLPVPQRWFHVDPEGWRTREGSKPSPGASKMVLAHTSRTGWWEMFLRTWEIQSTEQVVVFHKACVWWPSSLGTLQRDRVPPKCSLLPNSFRYLLPTHLKYVHWKTCFIIIYS